MISLVKPKYFIPVHGEYRHLQRHAEIAKKLGVNIDNLIDDYNPDAHADGMSQEEMMEYIKDKQ